MCIKCLLRKIKDLILKYYYIPLVFALTSFIFVIFLYIIDWTMPRFSFLPHNRTGDAWFSVLGCLLPAVASMLLSLVAIRQTQKINMLDRKMHRPALAFQSAKLTAWLLNSGDYEKCSLYKALTVRQQDVVESYLKDDHTDHTKEPCFCLLIIDLNMLLKNEINVEKIEIKNFKFVIAGKEYLFSRKEKIENNSSDLKKFEHLKHKFENGVEINALHWMLIAFEPATKEVWKEINYAMRNKELLNPCYEEFRLEIEMKIKFGLDEEREELLKAKIYFCSEEGYSSTEEMVVCVSTEHGRLMYC